MSAPAFDEKAAHGLLQEAGCKLLELRQKAEWRAELPARCPPILWFGNASTAKPIVLTVGANPSRQEYLDETSESAASKVAQGGDESTLSYLEPPANRFRLLTTRESLEEIETSESLRGEIITGYSRYFILPNHYNWFGKATNPYNVEAFLRGFGASYYEQRSEAFQALHIDLFPFATLQDFKKLQRLAEADLFRTRWAQQMIARLVALLKPRALIVFGRKNFEHFGDYVDPSVRKFAGGKFERASYWHGTAVTYGVPLVGLSTNLGNPRGFTSVSLGEFGVHVRSACGF